MPTKTNEFFDEDNDNDDPPQRFANSNFHQCHSA